MIVRILIIIVLIACVITFFSWLGISFPSISAGQPIQPVSAVGSIVSVAPDGPILPSPSEPVALTGTVMLDTADGASAVPYIAYINESGRMRTKQLIFAGQRGCNPSAGDLSCAPTWEDTAYPDLRHGEQIVVHGTFQQDRFVVKRLERVR